MHRFALLLAPLLVSLAGCAAPAASEATSTTAEDDALKATPPIPYVLQYTGEYDGDGTGRVDWLVFHANGKVDASVDGRASTVAYASPRAPGDATFTFKLRGTTYVASVGTRWNGGPVPAQDVVTVTYGKATETLRAPWIAGNESMCDDTGGSWTDDDADPATGLFCVCPAPNVYVPSAGGCVAPRAHNGDPARIPPGDAALGFVAAWDGDGSGRVASITLYDDGTWDGTIDGGYDWGTYWGGGPVGKAPAHFQLVFAGVLHGFTATSSAGPMTLEWGTGATDSETVTRAN